MSCGPSSINAAGITTCDIGTSVLISCRGRSIYSHCQCLQVQRISVSIVSQDYLLTAEQIEQSQARILSEREHEQGVCKGRPQCSGVGANHYKIF